MAADEQRPAFMRPVPLRLWCSEDRRSGKRDPKHMLEIDDPWGAGRDLPDEMPCPVKSCQGVVVLREKKPDGKATKSRSRR